VNGQGVFGPGVSGLCGSRGRAIEVNRPYLIAGDACRHREKLLR